MSALKQAPEEFPDQAADSFLKPLSKVDVYNAEPENALTDWALFMGSESKALADLKIPGLSETRAYSFFAGNNPDFEGGTPAGWLDMIIDEGRGQAVLEAYITNPITPRKFLRHVIDEAGQTEKIELDTPAGLAVTRLDEDGQRWISHLSVANWAIEDEGAGHSVMNSLLSGIHDAGDGEPVHVMVPQRDFNTRKAYSAAGFERTGEESTYQLGGFTIEQVEMRHPGLAEKE